MAAKIAVVTGAAQGIGQTIATTLAQEGADIVVADLDANRCEETVVAVKKLGRQALPVSVNVGDWDQVKNMMGRVQKEWERIDILVNNAGITRDGLLLRMKEEDWQNVLQVNLTGTFHCIKAAVSTMSRQRSGTYCKYCINCWGHWKYWASQLCGFEGRSHWFDQNGCARICQS